MMRGPKPYLETFKTTYRFKTGAMKQQINRRVKRYYLLAGSSSQQLIAQQKTMTRIRSFLNGAIQSTPPSQWYVTIANKKVLMGKRRKTMKKKSQRIQRRENIGKKSKIE